MSNGIEQCREAEPARSAYLNKTLERDQAYCAAFRESLVQENLSFYREFLGLKAWPLSSPFTRTHGSGLANCPILWYGLSFASLPQNFVMTDKAKQSLSRSQRRIYHPTFPGRGTACYTGQAGELNIRALIKVETMKDLLISLVKTAGIGGLALGVFLILFKRINLPTGTKKHITLFMWLVWSFCIFGVAAYLVVEYINRDKALSEQNKLNSNITTPNFFDIYLQCNGPAPGEDSSLAALFEYAENNEGEIIEASITTRGCDCPSQETNSSPIYDLQADCDRNPHWWASKLELNCVHSLNLVMNSHAGVASFCFPKQESLPLIRGYKRSVTAVEEYIAGKFIVYFEWSTGAPHVQLVVPEIPSSNQTLHRKTRAPLRSAQVSGELIIR